MRFYIESAKCGTGDEELYWGPMEIPTVAEVKIKTECGEIFYMSLAEVVGLPNVYKTEKSVFDMQCKPDITDAEIDYLNRHFIETGEYDEMLENKNHEWYPIFKYLTYLVQECGDESEEFIKNTTGKYLDEIHISTL